MLVNMAVSALVAHGDGHREDHVGNRRRPGSVGALCRPPERRFCRGATLDRAVATLLSQLDGTGCSSRRGDGRYGVVLPGRARPNSAVAGQSHGGWTQGCEDAQCRCWLERLCRLIPIALRSGVTRTPGRWDAPTLRHVSCMRFELRRLEMAGYDYNRCHQTARRHHSST